MPSTVTCDYGGSYALQCCHELLKIDTASHTVWAATFKEKLFLLRVNTDKTEGNFQFQTMNKIRGCYSIKDHMKKRQENNYKHRSACKHSQQFTYFTDRHAALTISPLLQRQDNSYIHEFVSSSLIHRAASTHCCLCLAPSFFHSLTEFLCYFPPPNPFSYPSRCRVTSTQQSGTQHRHCPPKYALASDLRTYGLF